MRNLLRYFTYSVLLMNMMVQPAEVNFIGIGDWGGYALGSYHTKNVENVSKTLQNDRFEYEAALNTGDNFYYCGIQNLEDENIQEDYISLFSNTSYPWISSLGNHDYGYNVTAQLELGSIIPNWVMPARYYRKKIEKAGMCFDIYVLDTNPCVQDYRNDDPDKWDPCGTEYPTCTPYKDPKPCLFHENILTQSCEEQYSWFSGELEKIYNSSSCWTIIMGHHTIYEIDVKPSGYMIADLISKYGDIYLNGHVHIMGVYEYGGEERYITTGAGAMVADDVEINNEASYKWYNKTTGYTRHIFSGVDIRTEFVEAGSGEVIYVTKVAKKGKNNT
jgi:tartrate-resistant acid phosphatase type 5